GLARRARRVDERRTRRRLLRAVQRSALLLPVPPRRRLANRRRQFLQRVGPCRHRERTALGLAPDDDCRRRCANLPSAKGPSAENMTEKKLVINGVEWSYATGGRGRETLLLFHGAVGGAETMRPLAAALEDEYHTVAPTVADVRTLDEVCDAVSAILDREH